MAEYYGINRVFRRFDKVCDERSQNVRRLTGEGVRSISIPLIKLLLQGIPELSAVVTLALVIARIPLKWNSILLRGTILALCTYVMRLFPIPFGIHTIVLIVLLFIILMRESKGDFSLSLLASLLSFLALVMSEFACLSLLMPVLGLTPATLSSNLVISIVIGEPQVIFLFFFSFLLNKLYIKKGRELENNDFLLSNNGFTVPNFHSSDTLV